MEYPDKWLVVKVEDDLYKVFATWSGGYAGSDSWRINSGIESMIVDGDSIIFTGHSDSQYNCRKTAYGSTTFGYNVLHQLIENAKTQFQTKIEILTLNQVLNLEFNKTD